MSFVSQYLPSKTFTLIATILIVLFGVSFYFFSVRTEEEKSVSQETISNVNNIEEKFADFMSDIDGDGLVMWEEALWGTNPNVADSDGDGTQDGVEIASQRNPLINTINDSLTSYPLVPSTVEDTNSASTTRTNALARAFMSSLYASSQKEGGTTPEDMDVLNTLLATEVLQNALPEPYTQDDVITTNDTDETLRLYVNTLGTLIGAYNALGGPYELTVISEAIQGERMNDLRQLERFVVFFSDATLSLHSLPVPQSLAENHLSLLNTVAIMSQSLSRVAATEDDIVLGFAGLAQYQTILPTFGESVYTIAKTVTDKPLSFSPEEPGKAFILPEY